MRRRIPYSDWLEFALFFAFALAGYAAVDGIATAAGWQSTTVPGRAASHTLRELLPLFGGTFPALLFYRFVVYRWLGWPRRLPRCDGQSERQ